jgi:CubicO group peptidase (beta-lactamase class C family)
MIAALERQAPWWEPGTASGYHALTQGYLIGEVVRRVTGQSLGAFFRAEIAGPLDADFHIGTPRDAFARIAELDPPASAPASEADADSIAARTFRSPAISAHAAATDGWRLAEIPAANGHGNARSIVRVQTAVANLGSAFGVNLLSEAGARRVFDEQTNGRDLVLGVPIRFGMGYGLTSDVMPMGPNEHIAYWGGWGGSSVVVDQDARLCVSYVMNRMAAELLGDMRGFSILQGAYASLA